MNERKDNAQKRILCDTVQFLEDYEWIFNFKVTHILQDNIVDRIPLEWFEYLRDLDIDTFDSLFLDMKCARQVPSFVTEFLKIYRSVKKTLLEKYELTKICSIVRKENRKISLKKQHEISNFSEYIANNVPTNFKIFDIGSGLGYIGEERDGNEDFLFNNCKCGRLYVTGLRLAVDNENENPVYISGKGADKAWL